MLDEGGEREEKVTKEGRERVSDQERERVRRESILVENVGRKKVFQNY